MRLKLWPTAEITDSMLTLIVLFPDLTIGNKSSQEPLTSARRHNLDGSCKKRKGSKSFVPFSTCGHLHLTIVFILIYVCTLEIIWRLISLNLSVMWMLNEVLLVRWKGLSKAHSKSWFGDQAALHVIVHSECELEACGVVVWIYCIVITGYGLLAEAAVYRFCGQFVCFML